jgi:3-oxoacyl-[acyl-carrier-protein] synthase-1
MMAARALYFDRVGLITSVGLNTAQTIASLRAGVSRVQETPFTGADGEPVRAGFVALSNQMADGQSRLGALVALALAECATPDEESAAPLILSCPAAEDLPVHGPSLLETAAEAAPVLLDERNSALLPGGGHAGFAGVLLKAAQLLSAGVVQRCYVGAADTYADQTRLQKLIESGRIASDVSPDGFIPGEAAAVFRVTAKREPGCLGMIAGIGTGSDEANQQPGQVSAVGLTAAARAALSQAKVPLRDVSWLGVDLTGERQRFYELAVTIARLKPAADQQLEQWNAAPLVGEIGAVIAPLTLAYLAVAFQRRWHRSPARNALFLGAGDGQLRCAILLREGSHG